MSTLYKVRLNPTLRDQDIAEENGHRDSFEEDVMKSKKSDTFYVTPMRKENSRAILPGWYEGNPNGGELSYRYHWSWLIFLDGEPDVS